MTLVSYICRQSAGSPVATGSAPSAPPALLTRTARVRNAVANSSTAARSVTSSWYAVAWWPASFSSAASASTRSLRRAVSTTRKPSAASVRAVAAPMPLLAPVTTAMGVAAMANLSSGC